MSLFLFDHTRFNRSNNWPNIRQQKSDSCRYQTKDRLNAISPRFPPRVFLPAIFFAILTRIYHFLPACARFVCVINWTACVLILVLLCGRLIERLYNINIVLSRWKSENNLCDPGVFFFLFWEDRGAREVFIGSRIELSFWWVWSKNVVITK